MNGGKAADTRVTLHAYPSRSRRALCLSGDRYAAARRSDRNKWARQAHHSNPSRQRGQQTARYNSGVWRDPIDGCGGDDGRPKGVQNRTRLRGLDRIGAASELYRRKGTPRLDFQARGSLPATTAGRRCNIRHQLRSSAALPVSLGDRTAGSSADQGGRGGAGQQDGADRLGGVGQGPAISGANSLKQRHHASGGLNRGIGLQGYVEDVEESRG